MIFARQMQVKENKYKYKCPDPMSPKYITIHNTANDASANNEVQYMINNTNQVSYHFAIDDKEVVQGLPLDRNAWAAGDGNGPGNRSSIHVELCYSKSGGDRYQEAEALAIKFVAQLLKERGWGIDRVKKHQDWSNKYCPHRILSEGRWQAVLNAIKAQLDALNNPIKVESKEDAWLMEPVEFPVKEMNDALSRVLLRFEGKDKPLDKKWREKLLKGELTGVELLGVYAVAIDRGYITGKTE